jgi:succinate-acetate transporter protein
MEILKYTLLLIIAPLVITAGMFLVYVTLKAVFVILLIGYVEMFRIFGMKRISEGLERLGDKIFEVLP